MNLFIQEHTGSTFFFRFTLVPWNGGTSYTHWILRFEFSSLPLIYRTRTTM